MKILIVTAGYFPAQNYGGPPVSVKNFCNLMSNEHELFILCSDTELNSSNKVVKENNIWHKRKEANVYYCNLNYNSIKKQIEQIMPDVIYIQSFFSAKYVIPTLCIGKKNDIPILLATRGELLPGAMKKKWKKTPYIKFINFIFLKNIYIQSTSLEEYQVNKLLLKNSFHKLLDNIPNTEMYKKNNSKFKQENKLKLIYLSRIVRKKNLKYNLEILRKCVGNIQFDIYGPIEDKIYWEECKKIIEKLPSNIKVSYCGTVLNEDISKVFNKYDFFFFLTKSENYGHVIAESILSGCPVIISNETPWNNIKKYENGFVFDISEKEELITTINKLVNIDNIEYNRILIRNNKYIEKEILMDNLFIDYQDFFLNVHKGGN